MSFTLQGGLYLSICKTDPTLGPEHLCPVWGAEHMAGILPAGRRSSQGCGLRTKSAMLSHSLPGTRKDSEAVARSEQWLLTMTGAPQVLWPWWGCRRVGGLSGLVSEAICQAHRDASCRGC